jgi:hypothetical protein
MKDLDAYLKETILPKVKEFGFDTFEDFMTSRLSLSLKETAEELGESYFVFQKFHTGYVRRMKGDRTGSGE